MKYLFDTKALIAFFEDEPGAEKIKRLLQRIESGIDLGSISAVTIAELYYIYFRRLGATRTNERLEQLISSSLNVVPVGIKIALVAGGYKMHDVSMADALIAASAYCTGAKVVTDDPHFKKLGIGVVDFTE